jgi:acetoin utilization protein AcuB
MVELERPSANKGERPVPEKVTEYMTRKVVSISPGAGVREAFFKMKEHHIRHLPVVEDSKLVGIVSDRELRRPEWVDEAVDISHVYKLDDALSIGDVMIKNVHVIRTYDSLRKAAQLLLDNRIGAAPVLDKTGTLVGMLSAVDLLRALYDMTSGDKA